MELVAAVILIRTEELVLEWPCSRKDKCLRDSCSLGRRSSLINSRKLLCREMFRRLI